MKQYDNSNAAPLPALNAKAPKDTLSQKFYNLSKEEVLARWQTIDLNWAATLIYHHKKLRIDHLQDHLQKDDSRFVTYDIAELIAYLTYAKEHDGADGIRLYFGVYPPFTNDPKKNSQTILFIPTINEADFVLKTDGTPTLAFNEGQICPPPYTKCNHVGAALMHKADAAGFQPID